MPALLTAPFTGVPPTGGCGDQARHQHHHRALAAAARSNDRNEFAGRDVEIDFAERVNGVTARGHVALRYAT
jgi:hypothetical protein